MVYLPIFNHCSRSKPSYHSSQSVRLRDCSSRSVKPFVKIITGLWTLRAEAPSRFCITLSTFFIGLAFLGKVSCKLWVYKVHYGGGVRSLASLLRRNKEQLFFLNFKIRDCVKLPPNPALRGSNSIFFIEKNIK